jgi:type III secretion protein L
MSAAIVDRNRFALSVAGTIVRREAWATLEQTDSLLEKAEELRRRIASDGRAAEQAAYAKGHAEGRTAGLTEIAEQHLQLQQTFRDMLAAADRRAVHLALAIIARIAPRIDRQQFVTALIDAAVGEIQAEQFLQIRVHPDVLGAVQTEAERWRQRYPGLNAVHCIADETLAPDGCVLQSEFGRVDAGLDEQLAAIANALQRTVAATERAA